MKNPTPAHEYAEIFSLHEGQSLYDLADRIKANGLREPIVLLDGKVLDGRRRERACLRAGVEPRYRDFGSQESDGADPLEFVIDLNLHRRHLGDGERQLAAARYATAKRGRESTSPKKDVISQVDKLPETTQEQTPPAKTQTRRAAAERFNVSEQAVDRGKVVISGGTESLREAVANDEITVSDAARVAKESPEVQDQAVEDVRQGKARTATGAVRNRRKKTEAKNGRPKFDDRTITKSLGGVVLQLLARARALGLERSPGFQNMRDAMDKALVMWDRWRLELEQQRRPDRRSS